MQIFHVMGAEPVPVDAFAQPGILRARFYATQGDGMRLGITAGYMASGGTFTAGDSAWDYVPIGAGNVVIEKAYPEGIPESYNTIFISFDLALGGGGDGLVGYDLLEYVSQGQTYSLSIARGRRAFKLYDDTNAPMDPATWPGGPITADNANFIYNPSPRFSINALPITGRSIPYTTGISAPFS